MNSGNFDFNLYEFPISCMVGFMSSYVKQSEEKPMRIFLITSSLLLILPRKYSKVSLYIQIIFIHSIRLKVQPSDNTKVAKGAGSPIVGIQRTVKVNPSKAK